MMMRMLFFSLCLLLGLTTKPALTMTLQTSRCSINVYMPELRGYYSEIRLKAIMEDTETGVTIVSRTTMAEVPEEQMCCFIRLILHFYVERVFRNYASDQPAEQRSISALANAFVTMTRNINKCHCLCNEDTQKAIDSVRTEFDKLSTIKAATKAVAELDTLLDWLDKVDQATANA
ncbi:interleukin 19 like [Corythoichthys intestinalis]|uniref:interleukin 19 like n=1 Tax=Corythoichthys intestinalis TaxID=161448 RepID=UPI0025A63C26|nr:interleukin 19 like [Corythoichthys intestinalis]XP_061814273.1 interleukin-20-like [Nerophis lumbriciformis]